MGGWADLIKFSQPPCRGFIQRQFAQSELAEHIRGGAEELKKHYQFTKVPSSQAADVYKFQVNEGGRTVTLYLKEHKLRDLRDRIKFLFRPSRSMRALTGTMVLAENSLKGPEFIVVAQRKIGFVCVENFTITKELANAKNVRDTMHDEAARKIAFEPAAKRKIIKALGKTIGVMHAKGICHGDLRLGNVLMTEAGGEYEFAFLDNERTAKFAKLPAQLRIKNLVQLNMSREFFSRTDAMRFWREYAGENAEIIADERDLLRQVEKITTKRLGAKARKRGSTISRDES